MEPVIGVTWRGSNRRINVYVFTYVAQVAGGDPMVDGGGFGDGYTLPGSFSNVPPTGNPTRTGIWGSLDGCCEGVVPANRRNSDQSVLLEQRTLSLGHIQQFSAGQTGQIR